MDLNNIKIEVFDISDSIENGIKLKEYSLPEFINEINLAFEFQEFDIETVRFQIKKEVNNA